MILQVSVFFFLPPFFFSFFPIMCHDRASFSSFPFSLFFSIDDLHSVSDCRFYFRHQSVVVLPTFERCWHHNHRFTDEHGNVRPKPKRRSAGSYPPCSRPQQENSRREGFCGIYLRMHFKITFHDTYYNNDGSISGVAATSYYRWR